MDWFRVREEKICVVGKMAWSRSFFKRQTSRPAASGNLQGDRLSLQLEG